LSIFKRIVPQSSFQRKAALFQDACGCGIIRVRLGIDSMERKFLEAIIGERWHHFCHDTVPPKFLTQPKADLGDMAMDILANTNTDAANCRAVDVDTKICRWLCGCCAPQEFMCILDRIWVRKQIAQPEPDTAVVSMFRQRRCVIQAPVANRAPFECELHGVKRNIEIDYVLNL
jgi:hypothetical protein